MAGRYVLLEFDDPDSAESFVMNSNYADHLKFNPVAMFVKPVKFCECPDKQRQHANNWQRGKRTGLFLCKRCRRPSSFHMRGLMERMKHVLGYNLLEGRSND